MVDSLIQFMQYLVDLLNQMPIWLNVIIALVIILGVPTLASVLEEKIKNRKKHSTKENV